jgi:hypothetical protein
MLYYYIMSYKSVFHNLKMANNNKPSLSIFENNWRNYKSKYMNSLNIEYNKIIQYDVNTIYNNQHNIFDTYNGIKRMISIFIPTPPNNNDNNIIGFVIGITISIILVNHLIVRRNQ